MEDLTGKQLGQYQIIAPLGEGGMAAVYKAYQLGKMKRYVALKILPQQLAKSPEFVKRFDQEANVLAKLQHPRILPVFDFGESEGYTYLAMPFIESGTLADLLHGKPLPLPQVRSLTVQVAEALDYAHSRGLVHRDVKPSNVLVDERGNCLLSDFGITKILEGTEKLTSTGGIIGTPAYMSPEQGRGETLDRRSDIYSLGVMLYELATGRVPYKADTPLAVIIKHMQDPLPSPRSINPALPKAVERVIFKALAKHGEDRYQTAGEMALAIQAAIPESAMPLDQTQAAETLIEGWPETMKSKKVKTLEPSASMTEKPKARLPEWVWAMVGVVALVIVGGLFAAFGRGANSANQTTTQTAEAVAVSFTDTLQPNATSTLLASPSLIASTPPDVATPAKPTSTGLCRVASVDKTGTDTADIYVTDCDSTNLRRMTEGRISTGHEPAWSPDGQRLVFDENQNLEFDTVPAYLYIINADGTNRTQIVAPDGPAEGDFPVWSPDGARIAWQGGCNIVMIRPDGSDKVTVLEHRVLSGVGDPEMCVQRPMWSPDSQRFAFATFPLAAHFDPSIPGPYEYRFYVVNADELA